MQSSEAYDRSRCLLSVTRARRTNAARAILLITGMKLVAVWFGESQAIFSLIHIQTKRFLQVYRSIQ